MKKIFSTICLIFLANSALFSQKIEWKEYVDSTFVYEIDNKLAEKFLRGKYDYWREADFVNLLGKPVAVYSEKWENKPSQGHFLHANIIKNRVFYHYEPIIPFQVFLFKEYGVLTLQVVDNQGNLRKDAKIYIRNDNSIKFDEESQTYSIKENSRNSNRLLSVELDGFAAFFELHKMFAPTYYDWGGGGSSPDFYAYMITDKNRYKPNEKVRFKSYALDNARFPMRSELEVWVSEYYWRNGKKIKTISPYNAGGYADEFVLNDSLKLTLDKNYKIFLVKENGQIVAQTSFKYEDYELRGASLETKILHSEQYFPEKNILEITAFDANGLYLLNGKIDVFVLRGDVSSSFVDVLSLPDTLMKKSVALNPSGKILVEIPAEIFDEANVAYRVETNLLTADNQLYTQTNNANFYRKNERIDFYTKNDTIFFEYKNLGISDTIDAILSYDGKNERKISLPYKEKFVQTIKSYDFVVGNTLSFQPTRYLSEVEGKPSKQTEISPVGRNDGAGWTQTINIQQINPQIWLDGGFVKDSFNFVMQNPLALDVSWYVYSGNTLLQKGAGKEIDFKSKGALENTKYFVEIFYNYGGKERVFKKEFTPKPKSLEIEADLPDRIYPSQTIDTKIKVTDHKGKPVSKVDLTAFAVNSQLNYDVPDLPYYGELPRGRERRDEYSISKKDSKKFSVPLDFEKWNELAHLDQLPYYQFIYPKVEVIGLKFVKTKKDYKVYEEKVGTIFKYEVSTPDNTTQFAPYLMENGEAIDIYVIELNRVPVYFSWAEQPRGYSFLVNNSIVVDKNVKNNEVILRLKDKAIFIDDLQFEKGKKTIISLDINNLPKNARVVKLDFKEEAGKNYRGKPYYRNVFGKDEKVRYSTYISRFEIDEEQKNVHLTLFNNNFPVYNQCFSAKKSVLVGPIPPSKYRFDDKITYNHKGGFSYRFEDNIVYATKDDNLFPKELRNHTKTNNFNNLNDFYISKMSEKMFCKKDIWQPKNIKIAAKNMTLYFVFPEEKEITGVARLILFDKNDNTIFVADNKVDGGYGFDFKKGIYDIALIYNNAKCLKINDVDIKENHYTQIDFTKSELHDADSLTFEWLKLLHTSRPKSTEKEQTINLTKTKKSSWMAVKGTIYDSETNETLIGATIIVKGTTIGTLTDIDGYFEIEIPTSTATLVFEYTGYDTKEVSVNMGDEISVYLNSDFEALSEVVMVGYGVGYSGGQPGTTSSVRIRGLSSNPSELTKALAGKVAGVEVYAYYEQKKGKGYAGRAQTIGASGDIPKYAQQEDFDETEIARQEAEEQLYRELMSLNGLRSNFSDVGFWEPKLFTDKKGEAEFSVTFPDNITKWNSIIYAMNRRLQTAVWRKNIQSYKPIMAELSCPLFLVAGDSVNFSGTLRNYTQSEKIAGNLLFFTKNDTLKNENIEFSNAFQEKLPIIVPATDSLSATYLFTRDDGYNDGERRTIPIEKQGTEVAFGSLQILRNGESLQISPTENQEIHLNLVANQADFYYNVAGYLSGYRYACNEQLASKLIGLISCKLYAQLNGKVFKHDRNINEIIKMLLKNQNGDKLWSWWGNSSETSYFMSAHVLSALKLAKDAGFSVNLNLENYNDLPHYKTPNLHDIEILHALSAQNTEQNFVPAVEFFEKKIADLDRQNDSIAKKYNTKNNTSYLKEKLMLLEIRKRQNLDFDTKFIEENLQTDYLGRVFCSDNKARTWYSNDLITTLLAYKLLKDDEKFAGTIEQMQMYIISTKAHGWNTYQSAQALLTIFQDVMKKGEKGVAPKVFLSGKTDREVTKFPFDTIVNFGEILNIEKISGLPIYCSDYVYENVKNQRIGEVFEVSTNFVQKQQYGNDIVLSDTLSAGKPVFLRVDVNVKKPDCEYVIIEAPIPAGCSYNAKTQYSKYRSYEVHREYFKEKTAIFCQKLPQGKHTFYIELLPRFSGKFSLNPAKIELMYLPVVNANNDLRKAVISE